MRVHELAKAVQLESKEVLAIAKRHRMTVKQSPSANVEDKDVRKLMPLIDKFKADMRAKEEQEKARKEEERKKKEEERRRKEEERRREAEAKRKAEEEERRRKEEAERAAAQQKAEEDRRRRDAEERQRREAETARKAEEERMRSLGLRVPTRPADYRPSTGAPADAPAPPRAPRPQQPAPPPETAPRPRVEGQDRPTQGQAPQGRTSGPGSRPTQGRPEPRPGDQRRPEGGYRPGGEGRRPEGGFRPGEGRRPEGGFKPGGDRRPETGYRQGGPGQQGGPGGYRQGGPGQQGQGGGYRQGGPGQQGQGGGYRQGGPGQGQGGGFRQGGPGQQGGPGGYRQGGPGQQQGRPPFDRGRPGEQRGDRPARPGGGQFQPGGRRDGGTAPAKLTEDNLPTIGVMRLDKHARGRDKDKDKKKASPGEKRGKVAPRRIFELDEDMTVTTRPRIPGKTGARPAMRMGFGSRKRGPRPSGGFHSHGGGGGAAVAPRVKQVKIDGEYTVGQFADAIGIPATEMIKKLIMLGEMLNLNQQIGVEMMEVLAPEFGVELEIVRPKTDEDDIDPFMIQDDPEKMVRRSPVVTIMGHVDHGKTSLLDYVRKSKVVEGEFGGITQHIGAYHVTTAKGDIVFLDTPGHEAFTSMRARGASVTDLVILVVASNDGFKPQTIEAVHHAQAAKVPIVVAVNKIDLPGADPARVRQEALQHNLVPEDFGGETIFVDISAKKGTNVDQLLEMVALQAEILDLKADPDRFAQGTIVESHVDPLRGAVATVLVQKGTLRAGDYFVTGDISGRVRAMVDDRGKTIKEAGPSFPVEIIGLTGSPPAGEVFLVMPDEKSARDVAERREARRRLAGLTPTQKHMTLEGLHERISEGVVKDLNLILKADVQGSIEAVGQSLEKLSTEQVRIRIIHTGVGGINESDVNLAAASDAIIIGFNIRPEQSAAELAAQEGVEIKLYRIIYDLIEEVRGAMVGLLDPTYTEKVIGHAEIRQVFRASKIGNIAGCTVRDGEITRDSKVRLVRDNVVIYEGKLASLKRVKEDVRKVTSGLECGILIENYNDIKEGDVIEAYQMEEHEATL